MILKHPKKGLIKPKLYIYGNCKILTLYNNEKNILFVNCEKKNHQLFKVFSVSYKSGF